MSRATRNRGFANAVLTLVAGVTLVIMTSPTAWAQGAEDSWPVGKRWPCVSVVTLAQLGAWIKSQYLPPARLEVLEAVGYEDAWAGVMSLRPSLLLPSA